MGSYLLRLNLTHLSYLPLSYGEAAFSTLVVYTIRLGMLGGNLNISIDSAHLKSELNWVVSSQSLELVELANESGIRVADPQDQN